MRIPHWLGLLLAIVVLRVPGFAFGILNIDESDFFIIGRRVSEGAVPYVDVVDIKPPLAYLSYLPAGIDGFSLAPMQLIGVAWLFVTCLALRRAAHLWTGQADAGWAAATVALIASSCDLPAINTELFLNLPIAGALLFFIRAHKENRARNELYSGVLISLATMFKQQAAIVLAALSLVEGALALGKPAAGGETPGSATPLRRLGLMWLGFLLPWAAVILFYAAIGHLRELYEWNLERNWLYLGQSAGSPWPRLAAALAICVLGAAPLPWALALKESGKTGDSIRSALALTLWLTWIPVSMGGRFYGHYFLQFVPPLALLAAPGLAELYGRRHSLRRARAAALVCALLLPVAVHWVAGIALGALKMLPGQDAKALELSRWLRENTRPNERLFIWGHFSPIYFLSQRMPGTRYVTTSVHMGNFDPHHLPANFDAGAHQSERDVAATILDLDTKRPAWVIDTAPADIHEWSKVPLPKFPEISKYIEAHYVLVARPAGAAVYRRRSPP